MAPKTPGPVNRFAMNFIHIIIVIVACAVILE